MKISEMAEVCHTSVRMLRFYENLNLLKPVRLPNGYRIYRKEDINYVKKIMLLNHSGLTLKEIVLLKNCLHDEMSDFCENLREKLLEKQKDIAREIDILPQSQALIANLLNHGM